MSNLIALDIETSGLTNEHEILSIGCCTEDYDYFYQLVKWDQLKVSTSAMNINQIDLRGGPQGIPLKESLLLLNKWLRTKFPNEEKIITIGFNVGSFDLRFMDKSYKQVGVENPFHYRHIELNSILMFLDKNKEEFMKLIWDRIKSNPIPNQYKWPANEVAMEHHALADALHSMMCYKDLLCCK